MTLLDATESEILEVFCRMGKLAGEPLALETLRPLLDEKAQYDIEKINEALLGLTHRGLIALCRPDTYVLTPEGEAVVPRRACSLPQAMSPW